VFCLFVFYDNVILGLKEFVVTLLDMTLQIKNYRKGYRFYCKQMNKYYGPTFKNLDNITSFERWYDGDPRYIETLLDSRKWKRVLEEWNKHR
jgi:hypothetical protein